MSSQKAEELDNQTGAGGGPIEYSIPRWYILRTMPQHEKKIAQYFQKKHYTYYLPLIRRKRRWSDRIKIIDFPLFPGYIFIRIDWFKEHVAILQHQGCVQFIRKEDGPAYMTEQQMDNLRLLVAATEELQTDPDTHFPPGQEVEIRFGAFKGIRGVVVRVKNKNRIYVRVPWLNQMISAELDIMDLEKVE